MLELSASQRHNLLVWLPQMATSLLFFELEQAAKHKLILKHFKKRLFSLVCNWNCGLICEIVICVLLFKREELSHFVYHIVFYLRSSLNQNNYLSCFALETSCYVFIDEILISLQFSKRKLIFRKKSWQNQSHYGVISGFSLSFQFRFMNVENVKWAGTSLTQDSGWGCCAYCKNMIRNLNTRKWQDTF